MSIFTEALPVELWVTHILPHVRPTVPNLLRLRSVCRLFRDFVKKTPVKLSSRKHSVCRKSVVLALPFTESDVQMINAMFGRIESIYVNWARLLNLYGAAQKTPFLPTLLKLKNVNVTELVIRNDPNGDCAQYISKIISLNDVKKLTFSRVLITRGLLQNVKTLRSTANIQELSFYPVLNERFRDNATEFIELTCDNVKTLQVFNCSMSILLAISKVNTLKNLILDDALGRLDVSHVLKLKGLRTLALHRHNMSRELLFQNVFVGIARVTSHVTSLDLSEWFGSRYIGCEALKRTLVKFCALRELRLSGMTAWSRNICKCVASCNPNLELFWYTPPNPTILGDDAKFPDPLDAETATIMRRSLLKLKILNK